MLVPLGARSSVHCSDIKARTIGCHSPSTFFVQLKVPPLEILLPLFEISSCAFCSAERRPALPSAYLFTSIWASFSNESSILKAGDAPPPGERDGRTTRTTATMQVAPAENDSNLTLPTLSYLSPAYEVLSILRCSSDLSQSLHTVMFEARVGKEICPAAAVPVKGGMPLCTRRK